MSYRVPRTPAKRKRVSAAAYEGVTGQYTRLNTLRLGKGKPSKKHRLFKKLLPVRVFHERADGVCETASSFNFHTTPYQAGADSSRHSALFGTGFSNTNLAEAGKQAVYIQSVFTAEQLYQLYRLATTYNTREAPGTVTSYTVDGIVANINRVDASVSSTTIGSFVPPDFFIEGYTVKHTITNAGNYACDIVVREVRAKQDLLNPMDMLRYCQHNTALGGSAPFQASTGGNLAMDAPPASIGYNDRSGNLAGCSTTMYSSDNRTIFTPEASPNEFANFRAYASAKRVRTFTLQPGETKTFTVAGALNRKINSAKLFLRMRTNDGQSISCLRQLFRGIMVTAVGALGVDVTNKGQVVTSPVALMLRSDTHIRCRNSLETNARYLDVKTYGDFDLPLGGFVGNGSVEVGVNGSAMASD
jgi:hypothetical protein